MRREVLTVQSVLGVFAFGDAAWSNDPEAGPRRHRQGVAAFSAIYLLRLQTGKLHISRSLAMHLQEFVVSGARIAEVLFSRVVRYAAFPSKKEEL